ncbi:hypothetical protein [Actinocrispum wychmicini]|uniref:Uncharacterized protein n=1 Tax=Actinocrispum wychmicini TaxID=1213861 RepID=A0A4R2JW30_9PSEU|nr:hypothetical protein [Actinocrispum wychmicini]TCO64691.1 hypothetical protein EV192_101473 [Actinocrispum wychmicini]
MQSYVERRREITERARALSDPDDTLTALWSEDPELAIDMAEVVNHLPTLVRALNSGVVDLQIRAAGSSSMPRLDPAVLVAALPDLPMAVRRVLYRRIRSRRLTPMASALIEAVHAAHGVYEAATLLPLCDTATVERWLAVLEHAVNQSAVAKRHPELMLTRAVEELAGLEVRDNWWRQRGYALDEVVEYAPARVLDLIERYGPSTWLPFSVRSMTRLAKVDASRFIQQLENRKYTLGKPAYLALVAAAPAELVWLGRQDLVKVLRAMPPSQRAEFFDKVHADKDMARVEVPEDVLRLLPRARRAQEARRMRAIAVETGDETTVHQLTSCLPFDEAREDLIKVTQSGEADDRADGYALLIDCAAKDFRLVDLLPWLVERLKREQNPVRLDAIEALAAASPRAFGDATELTQIATDAFDARDFSTATGEALASLCVKLLIHNGSPVALEILTRWWQRTGWSAMGGLGRQLRHGQEHDLFAALKNTIATAAEQVDFDPAFALARTFGRRAWAMPDLLELVWSAIPWGLEYASREAINLLLADPRARNDRVQRILDLDPTAVFLPNVLDVLQYARTDLLEVMLGQEIPEGTFAPKKVRLIPLHLRGTRRWLPTQRTRYAELVMSLADSGKQSRETRARAVETLGTIHGPAKRNILRYLDSTDQLVAQAAIGRLPNQDDPLEALDLLLERALGDNRGQAELTSMYTIRQCARRVAPSRLVPKLSDALARGGRVTVRKELVRLVSDFRLPDAVGILWNVWETPNQHRDVRAAATFVALSWLDDTRAWDLLRAAVSGPREVSMQVLRTYPYAVPTEHRAGIAALIREVAVGPDDQLRSAALGAIDSWAQWYPEAVTVLAQAVVNLDERAGWQAAAGSLGSLATTPAGEATAVETLHLLLRGEGPDADAERDRPMLQRARSITGVMTRRWSYHPSHRAPMRRIAGELERYDQFRTETVELVATTIDVENAGLLADLRDIERLVEGRPQLATRVGQQLRQPYRTAAFLLAATGELTNGHLMTGILAAQGSRMGWPEPWRDLLRGLRRHTDPSVRDAALAIMTATE